MKEDKSIYITINHLDDYLPVMNLKVGDVLTLKKEPDNLYDDEAIAIYAKENYKCGYVANSVSTVVRGTFSAGRLYDTITNKENCKICFIIQEEGVAIPVLNKSKNKVISFRSKLFFVNGYNNKTSIYSFVLKHTP